MISLILIPIMNINYICRAKKFLAFIQVTLKIRPLPPVVRYGSLVFPDWDSGFYFEREVARQRLQPSSIRLMDNEQVSTCYRQTAPYWTQLL